MAAIEVEGLSDVEQRANVRLSNHMTYLVLLLVACCRLSSGGKNMKIFHVVTHLIGEVVAKF